MLKFFADSETDDVDHVSEDGSADHLDHGHHDGLDEVVGGEVAVSNSHHRRIGPIIGVHVVDVPRFVLQLRFFEPVGAVLWCEVDHCVHDECLRERKVTKRWAMAMVKQKSSIIRSYFRILFCSA